MEISVPSSLQKYVKVEINVIHEGKDFKNSWAYLFQLNDSKVLERKPSNDPRGASLSISAIPAPTGFSNLQQYLQARLFTSDEEYVDATDDDRLQLTERVQNTRNRVKLLSKKMLEGLDQEETVVGHSTMYKRLDYMISLNGDAATAFSVVSSLEGIFLLFSDDFASGVDMTKLGSLISEEASQLRYVTTSGVEIYVTINGQRLRLLIKFYMSKDAAITALGRIGFSDYHGLTLPYISRLGFHIHKKVTFSLRSHPFAPDKLETPIIVQNKLLLKKNVFITFGTINLKSLNGSGLRKGTRYLVQTEFLQLNGFYPISDELEDSTNGKTIFKSMSSVGLAYNGQVHYQQQILDIQREFGGMTSEQMTQSCNRESQIANDPTPAASPGELLFKIYEIKKSQILYVGFSSILIPPFPGIYNFKNAVLIPQAPRKETEKTLLGFASFASVFHAGKRALLGFRTRNNQIIIEVDVEIQHFIPSYEKQALQQKTNILNQFAQLAPNEIINKLTNENKEKQVKQKKEVPQQKKKILPSIRNIKFNVNMNKVNQILQTQQQAQNNQQNIKQSLEQPSLPQFSDTQETQKLKLNKDKLKMLQQQYKAKKQGQE